MGAFWSCIAHLPRTVLVDINHRPMTPAAHKSVAVLLLVAWMYAALGQSAQIVLCRADNGHVAVERMHDVCESAVSQSPAVPSGGTALMSGDDTACADIPLLVEGEWFRSAAPQARAVAMTLFDADVAAVLPPSDACRAASLSFVFTASDARCPSALLRLRSVILLV